MRLRVAGQGPDTYVTGAVRIACGVPGATPDQALEMGRRYRRNENPAIASLAIVGAGADSVIPPDADGAEPPAVAPGDTLTLRATWADCPVTPLCGDGVCGIDEDAAACAGDCAVPLGCTGAEQYVFFDPELREVRERREAVRVSWFATAGTFAHDGTGRPEEEASQTFTDNDWTAPDAEGDVTLWAVIRDDRGGTGWQRYTLRVAR